MRGLTTMIVVAVAACAAAEPRPPASCAQPQPAARCTIEATVVHPLRWSAFAWRESFWEADGDVMLELCAKLGEHGIACDDPGLYATVDTSIRRRPGDLHRRELELGLRREVVGEGAGDDLGEACDRATQTACAAARLPGCRVERIVATPVLVSSEQP